tara:strand:- start:90 stop:599 length:510 start_codon:yes stop_codon:yes gene_type:complete
MINLLIISATSQTNLSLANRIAKIVDNDKYIINIMNIEEYELPLFNPSRIEKDKKKFAESIEEITNQIVQSDGVVICAPEYNGNVPPVLSNAIAWISVTTSYWKDGFKEKDFFIASSSGGKAVRFFHSMQSQLEHLGGKVFDKKIIITSSENKITTNSKNDLKDFLKLL